MPPDHGTGRGATLRAVLYFLASTPFLIILALLLHFSGILTLDKVTDLLHGGRLPGAQSNPPPSTMPSSEPTTSKTLPPVEDDPPPPNQPPQLSAPSVVAFDKGDAMKIIEVRLTDDNPAGLKVAVTSQKKSILPPAGLKLTTTSRTALVTVTPKPGAWGDALLRVTATDGAGLSSEAVIRVTVPEPGFTLTPIDNRTVQRGVPVSPIALKVSDESPVPGNVRFAALADGAILKPEGVQVVNDRLELTPVSGTIGSATVTVIASTDDGREDRQSFTLTVLPPPPPPLLVNGKARVTPPVDLMSTDAEAVGGKNLGVPDLERGTEVRVVEIRGKRVRITWHVGKIDHFGWVDAAILTAFE